MLIELLTSLRNMEKQINKKVDEYLSKFKNDIKEKVINSDISDDTYNNFLLFVYDYERLVFVKEDFMKRKRVKNIVPFYDRCIAKRANDDQCTRRKKKDCNYCGTHMKGTPNGMMDSQGDDTPSHEKKEVWVEDIMGICYYIDNKNNVYQAEDIVLNKINPQIIAKYTKKGDVYSIPEFGI